MLLRRFAAALDPLADSSYPSGNVVDLTGGLAVSGEDSALKIATVFRALNVAAAGVALLPLDIYDDQGEKGKRRLTNAEEPLRAVLRRRPAVGMTSYRWRHHLVSRVLLTGNYYAHKVRRYPLGPVEQLRPLDQSRWTVEGVASDGTIRYSYRTRGGQKQELGEEDVLHIRGFTADGVRGVSVFDLMKEQVALALSSRRARTSFMAQGMRPGVVIKHPGELSPKGEAGLIARFVRTHGGPGKAGLPLVLTGEDSDVSTLTISAEDAQWIEGEHFGVEEFLRFIGIPGVLVGFADKTATYASAESFFQSFVTHCLWPIVGNIEDELTLSLFGMDSDRFVEMDLNAMMRADSTARANFYRTTVELGIFTRNEVRRLENRNPLPGLDEPLTPKNMGSGQAPTPDQPQPAPRQARALKGRSAKAQALLDQFVRAAAARVVRKEVARLVGREGQKGLAGQYASNPAGWREAVARFYADHVALVAGEMHISPELAAAYCEGQRDTVLAVGVGIVEDWETERVAHLVRLAGGATC